MIAGILSDLDQFGTDEVFLLLVSSALTLTGLYHWWRSLRPVSKLGSPAFHRVPVYFAVVMGFGMLTWVIWKWADPQIRDNSGYVILVYVMGGACLTLVGSWNAWLGVGLRDDAFERRNPAAVLMLSGLALGVLITYSAANIGEGPSFWNNVFASLLATGSLVLAWVILAVGGGAAASIAEDRDAAAGLRAGSFLVAQAMILGRAVAGNWESVAATIADFARDGWLGLFLCAGAVAIEKALRPTARAPQPALVTHGLAPALVYLLVAALWLIKLGGWEGAA